MNETEKDRILRMVAEGTLRPSEAAHLLAALKEETPPAAKAEEKAVQEKEKANEPSKQQTVEVQMQRADGSYYTVQLPPQFVPMIVKMTGVMLKESARTAAQETWDGLKTIVRNKTEEVKTNVKTRVSGSPKTEETPAVSPEQEQESEARHRIIQMVQNGRISATDAARLIDQLDALKKSREPKPAPDN